MILHCILLLGSEGCPMAMSAPCHSESSEESTSCACSISWGSRDQKMSSCQRTVHICRCSSPTGWCSASPCTALQDVSENCVWCQFYAYQRQVGHPLGHFYRSFMRTWITRSCTWVLQNYRRGREEKQWGPGKTQGGAVVQVPQTGKCIHFYHNDWGITYLVFLKKMYFHHHCPGPYHTSRDSSKIWRRDLRISISLELSLSCCHTQPKVDDDATANIAHLKTPWTGWGHHGPRVDVIQGARVFRSI